jgi:hypothetical protein
MRELTGQPSETQQMIEEGLVSISMSTARSFISSQAAVDGKPREEGRVACLAESSVMGLCRSFDEVYES